LALRRTRKNKNYNKTKLAGKLDNLANNVAKKGVYIAVESEPGYKVIDYITKKTVIDYFPFKPLAVKFADMLNKHEDPKIYSTLTLQKHIDRYYKYYNDVQFYKHTIKTSKDKFIVGSTGARLQDAIWMLKEAKHQINNF